MSKKVNRLAVICTVVFLMSGCGSGSSVAVPQQHKAATVIFSATNAPLVTAVSGLTITAIMPAGANVRLKAGTVNEIDGNSLLSPLANSAVSGSYSAVNRAITLLVSPTSLPTNWGVAGSIGPFAEIHVDCLPNVTPGDFNSINQTFPEFKASNGTINNPTAQLTPSMTITGL